MRTLIVLIPDGYFVEYSVYEMRTAAGPPPIMDDLPSGKPVRAGRIRFRGEGTSMNDLGNLVAKYSPEAVAIRVLYGGGQFGKMQVYSRQVLADLVNLSSQSPLHMPVVIKLIRTIERLVPTPEILLYFETAFFTRLPARERSYAIDRGLEESYGRGFGNVTRYGYHGIFHGSVARKFRERGIDARRIVSVCLEPVSEVAGICDGKPVTVSGGATPLEGLPGNTTCGEIDPGIVLMLEDKKKWGPETINDVLTRKSGLTAVAGEPVDVGEVIKVGSRHTKARDLFRYRLLQSCGAAIGAMGGADAVAFSGRYSGSAEELAAWLVHRLEEASGSRLKLEVLFITDTLDALIAADYIRSRPAIVGM